MNTYIQPFNYNAAKFVYAQYLKGHISLQDFMEIVWPNEAVCILAVATLPTIYQ